MQTCPCCSNQPFSNCCQPIIAGEIAPTAEALVRSRYAAFVVRDLDHVQHTHAPEISDDFNRAEAERLAEECEWLGLHIHSAKELHDQAEVAFVVKFRRDQKVISKGAISKFRKYDGHWLFVSSKPAPQIEHLGRQKVGRNEACHCNSGRKFKKCCGNLAEAR